MSKFRLQCLVNHHRPVRGEVVWNGVAYVGKCKYCGTHIRRLENGGWRKTKSTAEPIFRNPEP